MDLRELVGQVDSPETGIQYDMGDLRGLTPTTQEYAMNMEFSTFPLFCSATYNDIKSVDDRFSRKMPYSGFLHHCTVALNLTLLRLMWNENNDYGVREELGTTSSS